MMLNVMALPNAKCIKCDHEEYEARCNIKMISPVQSPDGKWAHGVAQWWACKNCGHKFDPNEWVKKNDKDEVPASQTTIIVPPAGRAE
jgi:hypothetical protein